MSSRNVTRRTFVRDTATAAAATVAVGAGAAGAADVDTSTIRSYNEAMEYRPLGTTGLTVSAICLGGHWKRINKMVPGVFKGRGWLSADLNSDGFRKNRREVVSACIDAGINYIDACTWQEVMAYSEALRGRREAMHLGFSWYQEEMRNPRHRTCKSLLQTLDKGMKRAKLDYVDLWRITMHEKSSRHSKGEVEEMMKALEKAREQGKARLTGFSSHDRPHIKWMVETYPDIVQVIVTPYTAKSKKLPGDSLFDTVEKQGVGVFGIKPYSSGSIFRSDGTPDHAKFEDDCKRARLTLRYILGNPAVTAPIPGMINTVQVANAVKAVAERRKLDKQEEAELQRFTDEAWANLPDHYQWLKDWEWV
jgi:predicted aldo/keto reductase-like oxidoreductase